MIGPDRLARVSAEAVVPEQVVPYVCAVAGSKPRVIGPCVGYESDGTIVLVGYPLHDPRDADAMADAVGEALQTSGLKRLTVIGPTRPPQAPAGIRATEDEYFALPLPAPPQEAQKSPAPCGPRTDPRSRAPSRGRPVGFGPTLPQ